MGKKIKVALLLGGISAEREVSLASGEGVFKALESSGKFTVEKFDPQTDLDKFVREAKNFDVVFPVLHGKGGEDGSIQGLLELLQIKYVGSGIAASANAMDKMMTKELFRAARLPVADDIMLKKFTAEHFLLEKNFTLKPKDLTHRHHALKRARTFSMHETREVEKKIFTEIVEITAEHLGFPAVVKPACQGSSVGVSLAHDQKSLEKGLKEALKFDDKVIIEKFLHGTEITVGVIGGDQLLALEPIEIVANKGEFYDFESKYAQGGSTHILPARITPEQKKKAQKYALRAHEFLGCRHMSRTDLFVTPDGIFITEINTIPGFTPTSLLPDAAQFAGISFPALCEKLVMWALED